MSKNSRTPRAKSGTALRPLGALRLSQGAASQHSIPQGPTRNDPALLINQLNTFRSYSPPNQLLKEKEREYKILYDSYTHLQQDLKERKRKLRKKEEKEQKLKDHISALEKIIAELKFELRTKSDICEALKTTLDKKIKYYDDKLAATETDLENTKEKLDASEAEVTEKQERINTIIKEYEKKLADMQTDHEQEMRDLRESKDKEIKERDEKMSILKERMAETIGKNSAERQQQLEEMKRDLIKSSQEARELHKQLKYLQLKPQQCPNCVTLASQLQEKILQVRLKEKTINDLQNVGKSMQLQLHQQHKALVSRNERSEEKHRAMCIRAGMKPKVKSAVSTVNSRPLNIRWRTTSAGISRQDLILTKWEEREQTKDSS